MVTGEDETPQRSAWLTNTLSLAAVYALGVAAWFVSREVVGADAGVPGDDGAPGEENGNGQTSMVVGLALGYMSAVCYLCARIPQIIKNWREKSTEGMLLVLLTNVDLLGAWKTDTCLQVSPSCSSSSLSLVISPTALALSPIPKMVPISSKLFPGCWAHWVPSRRTPSSSSSSNCTRPRKRPSLRSRTEMPRTEARHRRFTSLRMLRR